MSNPDNPVGGELAALVARLRESCPHETYRDYEYKNCDCIFKQAADALESLQRKGEELCAVLGTLMLDVHKTDPNYLSDNSIVRQAIEKAKAALSYTAEDVERAAEAVPLPWTCGEGLCEHGSPRVCREKVARAVYEARGMREREGGGK